MSFLLIFFFRSSFLSYVLSLRRKNRHMLPIFTGNFFFPTGLEAIKVLHFTVQSKDGVTGFLQLFETVMDFKGLSFLVTEQSLVKKWRRLVFFGHGNLPFFPVIYLYNFLDLWIINRIIIYYIEHHYGSPCVRDEKLKAAWLDSINAMEECDE